MILEESMEIIRRYLHREKKILKRSDRYYTEICEKIDTNTENALQKFILAEVQHDN